MATTTTNFGWTVPSDTDLVKDGAAAMRTLGNNIDTSFVDLKGGTTGQVLSKASASDLDYTWVTPEIGDITAVVAGTGISGGGTTGSVTVTNSMATAIDAKGDLIAGTGADAFSRLAIGTNGHVLTADSAEATGMKWAAVAAGGGWTELASGSLSGSALTLSSISGSYKNLRLVIRNAQFSNSTEPGLRINGSSSNIYSRISIVNDGNTGVCTGQSATNQIYTTYNTPLSNTTGTWIFDLPDYTNTTSNKIVTCSSRYTSAAAGNAAENCWVSGAIASTSAITEISFRHTVTFNAGTYILYGGN